MARNSSKDTGDAGSSGGLFSRLKAGLSRTRQSVVGRIAGLVRGRVLDEETLEEIETVLLSADVGIEATTALLDRLRAAVKKQGPEVDALQVLGDAIRDLLADVEHPLDLGDAKPAVILMVGVNGAGKTTTIGKLAAQLSGQGKSVLLAAGDTFRAAAIEQLQAWGERARVPVVAHRQGGDSAAVIHDALEAARARDVDVVIADTSGRLHTDAGLMEELAKVKRIIRRFDPAAPQETLLVLDAGNGQNALAQAQRFNEAVGVSGLVLTKLDGTAKGGILLAIASRLALPVKYVGVGEGIEDLRPFIAADFAEALLSRTDTAGRGDPVQ
jgi:fused signal recognition particle receptor